ncbi:MAG: PEGA domain-containing protein [Treponema sp.]
MNVKKLLAAALFASAAFVYAAEAKEEPVWTITAAKFTLTDVPDLYASYAEAVPGMLNLFCTEQARRLVAPEEKKARKLMELGAKKLALIKERTALIAERDGLYLAVMQESEKQKKTATVNKKIAAKEKEIEKAGKKIDTLLADTSFTAETVPVQLWQEGKKIFEQPEHTNTAEALKPEKISAVINGSIQDLAGYMYVSAVLTTGLAGMPEYRFSEAGTYQAVESVTRSLAVQIMAAIKNTKTAKVLLSAEPADAEIYLNNERFSPDKKIMYLYEGSHQLEVLAPGYETASKMLEAKAGTNYTLKIKLKKEKTLSVGFRFTEPAADVFLHTQYFAGTPFQTDISAGKNTIVTFAYGDVKTYTVIRPEKFMRQGQTVYEMKTRLNKTQTKRKIERQRNILYWSLGAFYVSLPIFMILQGITADMASAALNRKLRPTPELQQKYRALFISTAVMQGITISLGINYAVQLGLYLYAAGQSIPKEAAPR